MRTTVSITCAALVVLAGTGCTTSFGNTGDGDTDATDMTGETDSSTDPSPDTGGDSVLPDVEDATDATGDELWPECGNSTAEGTEECDDGNDIAGDGCEMDCTWTCETEEECNDGEPCNGSETCNLDDHTCVTGEPLDDGALVDVGPPRIICLDGEESESICGDGFVDEGGGEYCEPPGEGACDDTCSYGCTMDTDCLDDGDICNGEEFCDMDALVCDRRDPAEEGTVCNDAPRSLCLAGFCQMSECGDHFHDAATEECDDGADGDDDDGCTDSCGFSCYSGSDCSDSVICNGLEVCTSTPSGEGMWCQPGSVAGSDVACDDHDWCTLIDMCNGLGTCVGTGDTCDDGLTCTTDLCDGSAASCDHDIISTSCLIDGVCRASGVVNLVNECQECRPSMDQTGWSPRTSSVSCSSDGIPCTTDHCSGTSEATCLHDISDGNCLISGGCYIDGQINTSSECLYCWTSTSTTSWTRRPAGDPCTSNGTFCDGEESCNGLGSCTSPGNPCSTGQTCRETIDACCADNAALHCDAATDNIHWYDSCGFIQGLYQDCYADPPTYHGVCIDAGTGSYCDCETHWTGTYCNTCPPNWDPAANCDACLGNYDPFTDCTACLPGFFGSDCSECRIYVSSSVIAGDGRSWATALSNLQTALDLAQTDGCSEVWVKAGNYSVNTYTGSTLRLHGDVAVLGGFNGTESIAIMRNWRSNVTVLTGNGSAASVVRCETTYGCNAQTRLDGFTVTQGYSALGSGGGLYCNSSDPIIDNCVFEQNTSNNGGAAYFYGGCDATITETIFRFNYSSNNGGAVTAYNSTPSFENCLFYQNQADNRGGAMYVDSYALPRLTSCTVVSNRSNVDMNAGGKFGGGLMIFNDLGAANISDVIFWGNTCYESGAWIACNVDELDASPYNIQMSYSVLPSAECTEYSGICSTGMISADPQFASAVTNDYHIKVTSPVIDVGTDIGAPRTDLDAVFRYDMSGVGMLGRVTDIGCYEAI